jgi:hypothetical protein
LHLIFPDERLKVLTNQADLDTPAARQPGKSLSKCFGFARPPIASGVNEGNPMAAIRIGIVEFPQRW